MVYRVLVHLLLNGTRSKKIQSVWVFDQSCQSLIKVLKLFENKIVSNKNGMQIYYATVSLIILVHEKLSCFGDFGHFRPVIIVLNLTLESRAFPRPFRHWGGWRGHKCRRTKR